MSLQNSTSASSGQAAASAPSLTPETRVLRQFRVVFNSVKTHFRQVERDAGLGGAQLWALSVIAGSPGIGVTELARALDIHQSTASNLVRTLTTRGLIAAARDGQDRRGVALRALPAADELLQRAPVPFAGVLPEALASLDEETLRRLEQDLSKLIEVLAADPASAQMPLAQL
ncbi:MarR family winged helix-turn-helix transcriptional regulator [Massilia sp. SYSU DXS3249]